MVVVLFVSAIADLPGQTDTPRKSWTDVCAYHEEKIHEANEHETTQRFVTV